MHKTDFTSDPVDRRKFIAGAASVSAAVAAAALTSCAPANQGASAGNSSSGADQSDGAVADEPSASAVADSAQESSTVYVTRDISPDGLQRAFDALGVAPHGNAAVKLSTGEPGGHNFLSPDLIGGLVQGLGATIVECNTAYDGSALIERLKSALLTVAWNADDWTFEALVAHYKTLVRYLHLQDCGMVLGYGCGTPGMTRRTKSPQAAYDLGASL